VGIYDERIFLPINFLRRPFPHTTVSPTDVSDNLVRTEYEYSFASRSVSSDDFIAFSAPWRGVPWLEACCGCPVRYAEGSLAPAHFLDAPQDLAQMPIPAPNGWFACMRRETERLQAQQPADCWTSPSILRGPSDVLAAMLGLKEFSLDLHDNPQAVAEAAVRVNSLLIKALDMQYALLDRSEQVGRVRPHFWLLGTGENCPYPRGCHGLVFAQHVSRHFHAEQR
jgi:hypothetical protein